MATAPLYPASLEECHEVLTLMGAGFSYTDVMRMRPNHRSTWIDIIKARDAAPVQRAIELAEPPVHEDPEAAGRWFP